MSQQARPAVVNAAVPPFAKGGLGGICFALLLLISLPTKAQPRLLDSFESTTPWTVVTSNQVSGQLRIAEGAQGKALCLDYDFNGVSGYVGLQRALPMSYPDNYAYSFQLRGDSPVNDLQFKLVDDSGDNVWWVNRPKYAFPKQWTPVVYKQRHISRAWGPAPDPTLRRSAKLEFTIYNSSGGKGSVCFDQLTFEPLPKDDGAPLTGRVAATTSAEGSRAEYAADGNPTTAWHAGFATDPDPALTLDLGRKREFGGVVLRWSDREYASDYRLQLSDDGKQWRQARSVHGGDGGSDYLALPESEARYLRLLPENGHGLGFGLAEFSVQPLSFAATHNDFVAAIAKDQPRGRYPRGFTGEQPYWTIVGVDGGQDQGLISEDGAIEVGKGAFSLEPFVISDGKLSTWADVKTGQSLQDGYLPIPSVQWTHPDFGLSITAFAQGTRERSRLYGRYRLSNPTASKRRYVFVLAARPFQVNPPSQFLNTIGGVSAIRSLRADAQGFGVEGPEGAATARRVQATAADASAVGPFDGGEIVARLARMPWEQDCANCTPQGEILRRLGGGTATEFQNDGTGLASGALFYSVELAPGESREFGWSSALSGPDSGAFAGVEELAATQALVAQQWRGKLDRVRISVPKQGQHVVDTLRTGLAHMLISRVGPRLQPGTRSYSRAWIRDGAMIGEGLLRMGREDVAEEFLRWYAPYQFDNGKVPCCVDDRGSDPVPENDSHGELIFTVAEVYRYRRDRALLEAMWPHVAGAVKYMDELRLSERTEANRARNPAFYGMMPASISHEGYSAKPMHSYWDNFWALRGYKDAVEIAQWLGKDDEARRIKASRDQFRDDLYASIAAATRDRGIDFIPGAAELGDFDATSTTIALAPGGEQGRLPETLLRNTFERYWKEFVDRRDGRREWKDYTPYELRTIGSFVRLGWRGRAHEALDFFFKDQQPRAWNQWAEVVSRTPRKPFFVGDLPHAWVESDYVRSALDLFAYTRDLDEALVIGAGLPADWLDGEGVSVEGLRTPYGELAYALRREGERVQLTLKPGLTPPAGGVVLSWPYPQPPGVTRIDGRPAQWRNGELRIERVPATVTIELEQ